MIYLGLDDTDVVGTAGTNQLARAIVRRLGADAADSVICRHQLFVDARVPFTSKNGSASIQLPACSAADISRLVGVIRGVMRAWFIPGSDPGLCLAAVATPAVRDFALTCQRQVVTRRQAREIARAAGIHLEGIGGTEQGIIGALAAVGLIAAGKDGRVVQLASWPYPDDFKGPRDAAEILARGVNEIRRNDGGPAITSGVVDVGNHLRPNIRGGRVVLFVEPAESADVPRWRAVKLP